MDKPEELITERTYLRLVGSCGAYFDSYIDLLNKTDIKLNTPRRIELYIFSAFIPYLAIILNTEDRQRQSEHHVNFLSKLLEYKPKGLTDKEFELMIDAQENGEDGSTVLDYIHTYYESWVKSFSNEAIEKEKRLTYGVSGLHIMLASRLAYLSDKYQDLEDKRFESMRESKLTEMMSIMKQQSEFEDSISKMYMDQINPLMTLTINHIQEVADIADDLS